jgi:predicted DCC family thiol-disulfide oxidoreductase YuxK
MESLRKKWTSFWFEPATADNLGLARILLFGSMAVFYIVTPYLFPTWGWHETFSEWGGVSHVFWKPIWLFRTLHLPQLSVNELVLMDAVWKVSLIFSAVGLFTRFSNAVAFILCVYLFGLANNFGKTHHLDILLLWSFLIMTVSRCGDSWSLDRLRKTARTGSGPGSETPVVSGEYTWPIRMIWVVMAMIYFEAGCSKARHSGIGWITGGVMSFFLQRAQYHITDAEPLTNWGLAIARHNWSGELFALMGMGLELTYPLALFSKRLRWPLVTGGMMMQIGIAVLMGPNFYQMIICQFLWLPLDKIVYWFLGLFSGRKSYTVVFDGTCGLCKRTVATVKSLDLLGKVEYLDAVHGWAEVHKRFPSLDQDRCLEDMHAIDSRGKVRVGFEAYRGMAWVLPLGWITLPIFYFPGVSIVGTRVYRVVADGRHNSGCALPPGPVKTGDVPAESTAHL